MAVHTQPAKRTLGLDEVDAWVREPRGDGGMTLSGPMALPLALLQVARLSRSSYYAHRDERPLVVVDPKDAAAWAAQHGHRVPGQS